MIASAWRTSSRSVTAAEASCVQVSKVTRIDLRGADLSDAELRLTGTGALSPELARLVSAHNGILPMLEQDDPFSEVLRALPGSRHHVAGRMLPHGTAAFLANEPERLLGPGGLRIPLPPRSDGLPQSVTVTLHATAERTGGGGFVREHVDACYRLRYSLGSGDQARHDERIVEIAGGVALLIRAGAAAAERPVRWFGKPADDDVAMPRWGVPGRTTPPPPAAARPQVKPAPIPEPSRSDQWLNDLTAMANIALKRYRPAYSDSTRSSRNSLDLEGVKALYDSLPEWVRNSPMPAVADRIAQAELNEGEVVLLKAGGYGFEFETTIELIIPEPVMVTRGLTDLYNIELGVNGAGYSAKIDNANFFIDPRNGVHYKTKEDLAAAGGPRTKAIKKPIIEFASDVYSGPGDPPRHLDHESAVESLRRLDRRLLRAAGGGRSSVRIPIEELLRTEDGWTLAPWVTGVGITAVFHPGSLAEGEMRLLVQLTAGVETTEISHWLPRTDPISRRIGHESEQLQADGLVFGRAVALDFVREVSGANVPAFALELLDEVDDVAAIRGLMSVAFTHVGAFLVSVVGGELRLDKNYLQFALRTSLWGARRTLSPRAREFTENNADAIRRRFERMFRDRFPRYEDDLLRKLRKFDPKVRRGDLPPLLDGPVPISATEVATPGILLDNALLDTPEMVLTNDDVFGIYTHFRLAETDEHGLGRVVGESRHLVPTGISGAARYLGEMARWLHESHGRARVRHRLRDGDDGWYAETLLLSAALLVDGSPRSGAFEAVRNAAAGLLPSWRGSGMREELLSSSELAGILVGLRAAADGPGRRSHAAVAGALDRLNAFVSRVNTLSRRSTSVGTGSAVRVALARVDALRRFLEPPGQGGRSGPPVRTTRSFEEDLVHLVRRTHPGVHGRTVLRTWDELRRIRGEAALPRSTGGRAIAVAQALSLPRERWHEILRLVGAGTGELPGLGRVGVDDRPQTTPGSSRGLADDPPARQRRTVRWADEEEGGSLTTEYGPPSAVLVEDLLDGTRVGVIDDQPVGIWLPGAPDDAPAFDEETLRRLTPPPDSVFVFGAVRDGRLMVGGREMTPSALAAVIDQRAHGLAPVLWMPDADEVAGSLARALGTPVIATPHGLWFDRENGKLVSVGPAHEVGAEDRSPDWFRLYPPDDESMPVHPELRVFGAPDPPSGTPAWPEPGATPPPVDEILDVDPALRSIGIPRAGLPNLPGLIAKLREQVPAGVTVPRHVWDLLPQRLLSNYSYLLEDPLRPGTRGLQVPLGPVEALIMLDPVDPRRVGNPSGSTTAPATLPAAPDEEKFHSGESINATYATGTHAQTRSGSMGATRGSISASFGVGLGPVLHAARFSLTLGGTANQSNRSSTNVLDAESGHVEVNKSGSVLLNYTPKWSFKLRTDENRRWADTETVGVPDPGVEKLLLWVPRDYLRRPSPSQVTAVGDEVRTTELPGNIFASGLTGTPQLFDEIAEIVRGQKKNLLRIGGSTRDELLQKLSNLDMHLDRAVNDKERGYRFLLNDEKGRPVASVEIHAERVPNQNRRVGATSDKTNLEDVRTGIDGTAGNHELVNNLSLTGSLGFDVLPNPAHSAGGLGVDAYASVTGTNTDAVSAGRTGLWVLVPRYTGHTAGYYSHFVLSATVRVRGGDAAAPRTTGRIPAQALLRMPEPAAYEHGFPVDRQALKKDPGDRTEVPFERDAVRRTGPREGDPEDKTLPAHVALGKGIGTGLVKLRPETTQRILDELRPILREKHFLPPEGDEFADRHWWSHGRDLDSRLDNELLLEKIHNFSAFYDEMHQDGVSLVLRRRRGFAGVDLDVDTAKIVIKAKSGKHRYIRTSDEFDTVNLAMGFDSAGQSTGGSLKLGVGVAFRGLFRWIRNGLTNLELQRTVGATDALRFMNNRPELLAYPGSVDEWELTSDYEITVEFQHSGRRGTTRPGVRDPGPILLEGETATAYILPLGDGSEKGPTSRFPTSVAALKQAVVYFADFSGMRDAVAKVLGEMAGPQGAGDQDLDTLAGTIAQRAHLKEILNGELTTDTLFDPGFFRDVKGALDVGGSMGETTFLGSTDDTFVIGIIKLWLAQASTSSTESWGFIAQLNAAFGGAAGMAALTGAADVSRRWQRSRSTSDARTGGTELIQLDFNRAYAYETSVDFVVKGLLEKSAKLLPTTNRFRPEELRGRRMIFLLPEPEALAQYATTGLPVSNERLADALNRWRLNLRTDQADQGQEPLMLSGDVVAKILMRWATEVPELPGSLRLLDRDELIRTLSELHVNGALPVTDADTREDFNRQFGTSLADRAGPLSAMELPEYLTREDPGGRVLGHHGVQDMTFDKGETTLKLVERKINEVAPGLLASDPEIWNGKGKMIGRVQGGIDSLQAILARGRDEAMLEDVLDPEGMAFYVVNPVGWLLADVLEIKLSAVLTSPPDVREFHPNTGLENYGHGYVGKSRSRSREGGLVVDYGRFGLGGTAGSGGDPADPPPSGSGTGVLRTAESHRRATTRAEQATSEQTVYDWTGHYRTTFGIELTTGVRRLDPSGRPVNNKLLHWFERWTRHNAQTTETVAGKLDLQIPRAIAEAGRQRGPASLRHFTPLPQLPHNAYVLGTLFGDAYGIAREMADDIFGREHGDTAVTHLKSLRTRLLPTHIRNHLWEATAGGGYTLAEGIFMPGTSSHRATMELRGDLYDLNVIGVVKEGTGTGMYVKHQSGTTPESSSGHWRSALDAAETATGTLAPHGPPRDMSGTDTITRATASGQAASGTENYRRELHVKEQGPVVMARMRGRFRVEADEFRHHLFGEPTKGAHFRSDPITGDVYAMLDQAQLAELRIHLAESARKARAAAAAWPSLDDAPAFDLGRLLIDAAREKFDAVRMYQEVARRIRAQAGGDRPLVLGLDQAAFGAQVLLSVLRWAEKALSGHDGESRPAARLARLIRTYRDLPPNAAEPAITTLINAVNALDPGDAPRRLPPEVPALAVDPQILARDVAHELDAHVRLDVTRPDGTTYQRWADSDGRLYAFDPLTFDDTRLSVDLARSAGLFPDTLRRDVDTLGINAFDLGRLYRTSWLRQQTFEQALVEEIGRRRAALANLDPRLPDLLPRAFALARRSAGEVRALEASRQEVIRRIADEGRRLEEVDGELFRLRADLDGQEAPPGEAAARARIQHLETEQDERERELSALSDRDQALGTRLSPARLRKQVAWQVLDEIREVARRPGDAERLDAVRRRVRGLLPAKERPDAARQRQVRRALTHAQAGPPAARATDAAAARLDVIEVALAAVVPLPDLPAPPSEAGSAASSGAGAPTSAFITPSEEPPPVRESVTPVEGDPISSAFRRWAAGEMAVSLGRVEGLLGAAGAGSLALVAVDETARQFVAAVRDGRVEWVEFPTGAATVPVVSGTTGAFLAFGPDGAVLDPPSRLADAAVVSLRRLHAASRATIHNRPGAIALPGGARSADPARPGQRASPPGIGDPPPADVTGRTTAGNPRPPWYARHGALGDGSVTEVRTLIDTSVDTWIGELTAGMKPAAADTVRGHVLALFAEQDGRVWEKLLRSGALIRAKDVRVKLTFGVEGTGYEPPAAQPAEAGPRTFAATLVGRGAPPVRISSENESGRSTAMEVTPGDRVIADATHGFAGRIRVHATVDRKTRPRLLLPGSVRLAFPAAYSSPAETLGPPGDGAHPVVRVTEPTALQGLEHAVNAVIPAALPSGLRGALEALDLPRATVDELVHEAAEEFFNEKTLRAQSRSWLAGGWVSSVFTAEIPGRSRFSGHLEVRGRPHTVRYVTTTDQDVLLRNDIADTPPRGTMLGGGEAGAVMRSGPLVRYLTEFTMVVTVRSATHGDREFAVPVVGELGIGRAHAAYFERFALEGPTGSGLRPPGGVPEPATEPATAPALASTTESPEPRRVQRLVGWLRSRFTPARVPWPFTPGGVHRVDDLLTLADRRAIEIAVPPELHRYGVPHGALATEGWEALRAYANVSWVYLYPESSERVSRAEDHGGSASWRYVLDAGARVVGALFMAPETTLGKGRRPTGYVPNPAVPPAVKPPTPRPWYDGLLGSLREAGLDAVADHLQGGGVPQIQLTDAVRRRVAAAPEDDPLRKATRALRDAPQISVVAADGGLLTTGDAADRKRPEARFVIGKDGGVRGPSRVWRHVVHPAEPIELAAREGLGPGVLRETPGLERVFREAQRALGNQIRSAGVHDHLSAADRQHLAHDLATKFGVLGLRGAYPELVSHRVAHEVTAGGRVFTVAVSAELGALRPDPGAVRHVDMETAQDGLARTDGDVTRFEYEAVYTLAVTTRWPEGAVEAAQVQELSGDDYWVAVTVSDALLPETPVPPDDIVAHGRVALPAGPPADGGPGRWSRQDEEVPVERPIGTAGSPPTETGQEEPYGPPPAAAPGGRASAVEFTPMRRSQPGVRTAPGDGAVTPVRPASVDRRAARAFLDRSGRDAAESLNAVESSPGESADTGVGQGDVPQRTPAPHIEHDASGVAWASPHRSAHDADGTPIPDGERFCVSVAVIPRLGEDARVPG